MPILHGCAGCRRNDVKLKACTKCTSDPILTMPAYYCGKDCQKHHWLSQHKEFHKIIDDCQQRLAITPEDPYVYYVLAVQLAGYGRYVESFYNFVESVQLSIAQGPHAGVAEMNCRSCAQVYAFFHTHDEAMSFLQGAGVEPPNWLNQLDHVRRQANECIEWAPDYIESWGMLGSVEERGGNYAQACAAYQQAMTVAKKPGTKARFQALYDRAAAHIPGGSSSSA